MRQTLLYIPKELFGYPLFGWGLLLAIWAIASLAAMAWLVRRQGFNAETLGYLPLLGLVAVVIVVVLPAISEDAGLPVRGYGAMLLLALLAALGLAQLRARRRGLDPEIIQSLALWLILAGIGGARLFYILEYPQQFFHGGLRESLLAVINLAQGGLVVYGSIFGGAVALAVFAHRHRLPGLALADLVAPSLMIGVAIGRIGCLLNGCCFGSECDLPFAIRFPYGSPAYVQQMQRHAVYLHGMKLAANPLRGAPVVADVERGSDAAQAGVKAGQRIDKIDGHPVFDLEDAQSRLLEISHLGQSVSLITSDSPQPKSWTLSSLETTRPVHPTQLYSTLDGLLICLFLLAYDPFKRRDGELLAWTATIYPITRFLIEMIRTDEGAVLNTGLTISQNVSLAVLAGAVIFWAYLSRQPRGLVWTVQQASPQATIAGI